LGRPSPVPNAQLHKVPNASLAKSSKIVYLLCIYLKEADR